MKKAIQIAYNKGFEKRCEYAAIAGFKYILVNFNDMPDRSPMVWAQAPENMLRILEKNGLACIQTHLPYYDLRISAEVTDDELEKAIINSLKVAGEIGAQWNVYHPRAAVKAGFCASKTLDENIRRISGYLEAAEKYGLETVNVVPQPKAGGSFATTAYENFTSPAAVEHIRAHAGIDIGGTLIGMHLRDVAVPVRLSIKNIGEAGIICARTREKFIGGSRAVYHE